MLYMEFEPGPAEGETAHSHYTITDRLIIDKKFLIIL